MKKLINLLCIFCIMIISFAFSSCKSSLEEKLLKMDEVDRAEELSRLSDEAMEAKKTYKSTMLGNIETKLQGNKIVNEIKYEVSQLYAGSNNFAYQKRQESVVKYRGEESTTLLIEGFQNGFMYVYNKTDSTTNIFKSPITIGDYVHFLKDMETESELKLDRNGCNEITAKRNDDGTWTVSYSKFTKENLKLLLNDFPSIEDIFDESYEITDAKMVINVMNDFSMKSATMEFEFTKKEDNIATASDENIDTPPVFLVEYAYEYENVTEVAEKIDLSQTKFKQVDDLRYFYNVEKELDELKESSEARAKLQLDSTISLKGKTSKSSENDNITFKNKDGALEYEVKATVNDEYYVITYSDSYQEVSDKSGTVTDRTEQSEMEARLFLEKLLDPADFKIDIMKNIEKTGENQYTYTLKPDIEEYEMIASLYGGYITENSATLVIEMLDDKIASYSYDVSVKIFIGVTSSYMDIAQSAKCTYEY